MGGWVGGGGGGGVGGIGNGGGEVAGQGNAEKTAPSDINFCQQIAVPKNVVAVGWNHMRSVVV